MRSMNYIFFTLAWVCVVAVKEEKLAKHFSLFSVVTFGNEECTSSSSISGGATTGTCYSSTECSDKSGMASGNCANGFGVCCVFLNTAAASATITENRTRVRNSEFPSIATATTAQTMIYTVNKMKDDICQIRLDFGTFIIAGPSVTTENFATKSTTTGSLCQDSLTLTTTDVSTITSTNIGVLCGMLTGEHLYVDLSPTASDALTATLTTLVSGTLTPAIAARVWDIKFSQIECHATYKAPDGCQRYFMGESGKLITMNFGRVTGATRAANAQNAGVELGLHRIKSCIRRAAHACCVEYQLCTSYNGISLGDVTAGVANAGNGIFSEAFIIDTDSTPWVIAIDDVNQGHVDAMCTGDYVEIPSSMSRTCGAMYGSYLGTMNTRYCGSKFGANLAKSPAGTAGSTSVCDCSEPFSVTFSADDRSDGGATGTDNIANVAAAIPRGACIDFKQTPCYN